MVENAGKITYYMEDRRIAIIDSDSIVWETAYVQAQKGGSFREHMQEWFYEMFNYIGATHYVGIIGNHSLGIRKSIVPTYKANRPPKPDFYKDFGPAVEYHLLNEWGFIKSPIGYEADDAVASYAKLCRTKNIDYVICGKDKDLLQIEGQHYNYTKKEIITVSEATAAFNLLVQLLAGDSTDNIPGIPGVGPVKAQKIIIEFEPYHDVWSNALVAYRKKYGPRVGAAKFAENYLMVYLNEDLTVDLESVHKIQWPSTTL